MSDLYHILFNNYECEICKPFGHSLSSGKHTVISSQARVSLSDQGNISMESMKADVEPDQPHRSKGLLKGISPDQVASSGVNIYDPNLTVEQLWGEDAALSGGALLDHVLAYYSDGQKDIPFFYTPSEIPQGSESTNLPQKARAVVKSPLSRELQESTVESYKKRIFLESISQVAAGRDML